MLKAAENIVKIEGILSEIDIETGSYMKNGQSCERISGSIKIRVNQKLNGEDKELDIPVKFIGVGEKIDDMQEFDSEEFVEALFN